MGILELLSLKANKLRSDNWKKIINDPVYVDGHYKTNLENRKKPYRTDVINYLLSTLNRESTYLEIGVRNPNDNFNKIKATKKYSVDPGVEFEENPVDFKMTSDVFFEKLSKSKVLNKNIEFDVIFIDGLHLAEQVDRDIQNAVKYLKEDGFIILHDCNPPTEWHARETFQYNYSPAGYAWNGTTWKAFLKWRSNSGFFSCCIDTDWGVGVLSKKTNIGESIEFSNQFFEYQKLNENRKKYLNLVDFKSFKSFFEAIE